MKLSIRMRKRFIKDFSLKIMLIDDPYFDYFIDLYDSSFNTKEKLQLLYNCLYDYDTEENFTKTSQELHTNILNGIKNTSEYARFISMDMKSFELSNSFFSKDNIFKQDNDKKSFISIDLKEANHQVLNLAKVVKEQTYSKLLQNYTKNDYLFEYTKSSKHIRQIIYGQCCPSRQASIQKYCINKIVNFLLSGNIVEKEKIRIVSFDEIIIESEKTIENLSEKIYDGIKLRTKTKFFTLEHRIEPISYYIQHLEDGKIEMRTVPITMFAQVFKSYYNLPLTDYDKRFLYEGKIAQFIN